MEGPGQQGEGKGVVKECRNRCSNERDELGSRKRKYAKVRESLDVGSPCVDEWTHFHLPAPVYHGSLWSFSFPNSFQSLQAEICI